MLVLVDTPIWSAALRRRGVGPIELELIAELRQLIQDGNACVIGPVRQEILSGIAEASVFRRIRDQLRAFSDLPLGTHDFEAAAELYNKCRKRGVAASQVDLMICAAALREEIPVFTTDRDFDRYSSVLGVALHRVRARKG